MRIVLYLKATAGTYETRGRNLFLKLHNNRLLGEESSPIMFHLLVVRGDQVTAAQKSIKKLRGNMTLIWYNTTHIRYDTTCIIQVKGFIKMKESPMNNGMPMKS